MRTERLVEGGYIVWGTEDPTEAQKAIVAPNSEFWENEGDWVDEEFDHDVVPAFSILDKGLMRRNPCTCYDHEHGWHLAVARKRGHGAQFAVWMEFEGWVPEEFDGDPA